jgi:hypothetical protein
MKNFIELDVAETYDFLQAKVADGNLLYGSSEVGLTEIDPQTLSMTEHDRKTDRLLLEGSSSVWVDDPENAIFRATYVEPFREERRAEGYVLGTLGVSITWTGLTSTDREFRGFDYHGTEELAQRVASRAGTGALSAVYFAPKEELNAGWREGMHDWIVRGRVVRPAGFVAVTGAHFRRPLLPYVGYIPPTAA